MPSESVKNAWFIAVSYTHLHLERGADITAVCTANGGFVDNATYLTLESDGAIGQIWCAPTAPRGHRSLEIYILSKQLLLTLVDECSAQDKYSFRRDVDVYKRQELIAAGRVQKNYREVTKGDESVAQRCV